MKKEKKIIMKSKKIINNNKIDGKVYIKINKNNEKENYIVSISFAFIYVFFLFPSFCCCLL